MRCIRLLSVFILIAPITTAAQTCTHFSTLRQPFFGDLHVHTRYSLDASTQGTLTTPDQAYRFAKGALLDIQPWRNGRALRAIQLRRPLDFAMVSDHAELMGETQICTNPAKAGYTAWQCRLYRNWPRGAYYWFNYWSARHAQRVGFCDEADCAGAAAGPWTATQQAAQAHYDRSATCGFTTFVGYEWTGGFAGDATGNIHRNVVFKNAQVPALPISFMDAQTPSALFTQLDSNCVGECEALVIPHNSNLSAGLMFTAPDDPAQAAQRARYEVLAEIMQHKGASECHFAPLSSVDEHCAFEQLGMRTFTDSAPAGKTDGFLREVLKEGLTLKHQYGVNPFAFGFIGSTDTHLGAPGMVEEASFVGHGGAGIPAADEVPAGLPDFLNFNPGGLAVLWAEENSRPALFAAMRRREAYATSGPRMKVRMFAGEQLPADMCEQPDFAQRGYRDGVPMGAELQGLATMTIALQAGRDAQALGLAKIQLIKGWLDAQGQRREVVVDLEEAPSVHRLDVDTCQVEGTSAAELCAVWQDPDFDPRQPAFYYGRILQGPSCRWSQHQCVANAINCDDPTTMQAGFEGCCDPAHQPVIQERAWTSPVWYQP